MLPKIRNNAHHPPMVRVCARVMVNIAGEVSEKCGIKLEKIPVSVVKI